MYHMLMMLFSLLLAGCVTLGGNTMKVTTDEGERAVSIDPIASIGLEWTEAMREGKFQASLGNFPDGLFSDMHPLRFRYMAVAYGERTGKEYPAQALYAGYAECGLRLMFIVEGNPDEPIIGAFATTRFTRMFTLYGEEISVKTPEKLSSDAVYRKDVVLSGGTAVSQLKKVPQTGANGLIAIFSGWNTAKAKGLPYEIRTPVGEKFAKSIARENPEYAFSQKLVGNGRFGINPFDWFSTAVSAAQDVLVAASAPDKGWDESSQLKRGYEGMIARIVKAQYDAAIRSGMSCGPEKKLRVKY